MRPEWNNMKFNLKEMATLMRKGREMIPTPAYKGEWFDREFANELSPDPTRACSMACVVVAAGMHKNLSREYLGGLLAEMGLVGEVEGNLLIEAVLPDSMSEYFDEDEG